MTYMFSFLHSLANSTCFEGGEMNNTDAGLNKEKTEEKSARRKISPISCNLYYDTERNDIQFCQKAKHLPPRTAHKYEILSHL